MERTVKLDGVAMVNRTNNARRYSEAVATKRRNERIEKAKRKLAMEIIGGGVVMTGGLWAIISGLIIILP